jgi:hypothetical protein
MNAEQLARAAYVSTAEHARSVSTEVREKLEFAHIAQWLLNQDESVRAKAAETAVAAMEWLLKNGRND